MDSEQVTSRILSDARKQAAETAARAAETVSAEKRKLDDRLKEYSARTEAMADKAREEKINQVLARARVDSARQYLAEKVDILDEIFAEAERRIRQLPDERYGSLFAKFLCEAVETGDEEVVVDQDETRIDAQLLEKVNGRLNPPLKRQLKLSEQREKIGAGFVLKRGRIRKDFSLRSLLAQAQRHLEGELAGELFS